MLLGAQLTEGTQALLHAETKSTVIWVVKHDMEQTGPSHSGFLIPWRWERIEARASHSIWMHWLQLNQTTSQHKEDGGEIDNSALWLATLMIIAQTHTACIISRLAQCNSSMMFAELYENALTSSNIEFYVKTKR